MKLRKIKHMNRPGNRREKTEKQIEAHKRSGCLVMITNNPMKNPEIAKKFVGHPQYCTGRTYFKPGNKLGKMNKGKKVSEERKKLQSIRMLGRKPSPNQIAIARINFIENNPMNNPEIAKKVSDKLKGNKALKDKFLKNNPMKNPEVLKKRMLNRKKLMKGGLNE